MQVIELSDEKHIKVGRKPVHLGNPGWSVFLRGQPVKSDSGRPGVQLAEHGRGTSSFGAKDQAARSRVRSAATIPIRVTSCLQASSQALWRRPAAQDAIGGERTQVGRMRLSFGS